tara:strand:+ start:334 stop:573 length:240 start_codon:yes stop_codon:yes gene_type:complete
MTKKRKMFSKLDLIIGAATLLLAIDSFVMPKFTDKNLYETAGIKIEQNTKSTIDYAEFGAIYAGCVYLSTKYIIKKRSS